MDESNHRVRRTVFRVLVVVLTLTSLYMTQTGCATQRTAEESMPAVPTEVPLHTPTRTSLPARYQDGFLLPAFAEVEIVGFGDEFGGSQHPAYLAAELTGRDISHVTLLAGSVEENGRRRIMRHEPVDPDVEDEAWPSIWTDGVHELRQTWDFTGDYLWDGQNGDFVVLWRTDPSENTGVVHGRFRAAGEDVYKDSILIVDTASSAIEEIIETSSGLPLTRETGDEFQLTNLYLDEQGALQSEIGRSLFLADSAQLAYASRPVPNGGYFFGLSTESVDGDIDSAYASFAVNNDSLWSGQRAYLDPSQGFQFFYPETWYQPAPSNGMLVLSDPTGKMHMGVSSHPDMIGQPVTDLKRMALGAYGDVAVLYEDQVVVGQEGGLRTIYGYESPSGPRTGILLAFNQDGQAYLVDIDGPSADEPELLEIAGVVADSWSSRTAPDSARGRWMEVSVDGQELAMPTSFRQVELGNGWHHFAGEDEGDFFAVRVERARVPGLFNMAEDWLEVASRNVNDFAASAVYSVVVGENTWARVDFTYTLETGDSISGAIMVTRTVDGAVVLWTEAETGRYQELEQSVYATVVDELNQIAIDLPG